MEDDVQKTYQQLSDRDHVLKRPDTYVGTLKTAVVPMYVVKLRHNLNKIEMEEREIPYIAALERIFLEILSNAADNAVRSSQEGVNPGLTSVKIEDDCIEIYNEGIPVPTDWHKAGKTWIPSMIFFNLRAGSNFDDTKTRKWGGRNGFGAKLTGIFSTLYQVTCHNKEQGIEHFQEARNNLGDIGDPVRTEIPKDDSRPSFTSVKFYPDFMRFYTGNVENDHSSNARNLTCDPTHCFACWKANNGDATHGYLDPNMVEMFAALVFDFSFNNRIPIKFEYKSERFSFSRKVVFDASDPVTYAKSFFDELPETPPIYYETEDHNTRVVYFDTPLNGFQRSFANALPTREGGVHVNAWLNALCVGLKADLEKKAGTKTKPNEKKKSPIGNITAPQIAPHVTIFISHYCENPAFSGQNKEKLTAPIDKNAVLPPDLIKKFSNWDAYVQIEKSMVAKARAKQNKALNPKRAKFLNIGNMDDAGWAGTAQSDKTVGFICEGLSAKNFFVQGLAYVTDARDRFGCLPIRGKVLNTSKASDAQILDSKIIENIIMFYGLQLDIDYREPKARKTLRYGAAVILVDADVDGIHIKTLLINFFGRYTGLLESGYVRARLTPVLLLTKGQARYKFYSTGEYEKWKATHPDYKTWKANYFKGLGSVTPDVIKDTFIAPVEQRITCDEDDRQILHLAMAADTTEDRKTLYKMLYDCSDASREDSCKLSGVQGIIFEELILFAKAANVRAIPRFSDGLKASYRQAVYTLMKTKNQFQEIGVLYGLVKALTKYHHGDVAMVDTLVGMAQTYPGSNNINLLDGESDSFGSRMGGGKDHAAGRYLKGKPGPALRAIFRPEDDILLVPVYEDGSEIGVETFFPIIPVQLVNRSKGIGWGWASDCPNYHPQDVVNWIKAFIVHVKDGSVARTFKGPSMLPWYRGYKGMVFPAKDGSILSRGYFEMRGYNCYIYDLPIGVTGKRFEKLLGEKQTAGEIEGWKPKTLDRSRPQYEIFGLKHPVTEHRGWLLETVISDTQMTFLDDKGLPNHYIFGVNEVLAKWCSWRYSMYVVRKVKYLEMLREDAAKMQKKVDFIEDVIANPPRFDIRSQDDDYITNYMNSNAYPMEFLKIEYRSFSKKHVDKIRKQMAEMMKKIEIYESTHPGDLWIEDLDDLIKKLEASYPGEWKKHHGYGTPHMVIPP